MAPSRSRASSNGILCRSVRFSVISSAGSNFAADLEVADMSKWPASRCKGRGCDDASSMCRPARRGSNRHRLDTLLPQSFDRQRTGALGQAFATDGRQKIVVPEARRFAAQRLEKRDLNAGVGDMVVATDDMRDAEVDIVDDGGQRIKVRAVLAHQHRVRQRRQIHRFLAANDGPGDLRALRFLRIGGEVRQEEAPVRPPPGALEPGDFSLVSLSASRP